VDFEARAIRTAQGAVISWDRLVLAAGSVTATFGVPGVAEHGFGLKSLADALRLRSHLLRQFELADADPSIIDDGAMSVVIAGGGPTGVELAGALAELFSLVLVKDYPHLDVSRARVVLVEGGDRLLPAFDARLGDHARRTLEARGIEVIVGRSVAAVTDKAVELADGTTVPTPTVVWAAGVRPQPLAAAVGLPLDRSGRVEVGPDLRVPTQPAVFVIGDLAAARDRRGNLLPQLAPVAIQQGRHVASELWRERQGQPARSFRYRDKGSMATIGRNDAIAQLPGRVLVRGFPAWVLWLTLHLVELIGFRNRASVLVDWTWNYLTYDRGARIIADLDEQVV
jgi:NADH dehydrogenase